eukprot:scaffold5150_cov376-Prasinococcus_capsulatus_cf.AAC.12
MGGVRRRAPASRSPVQTRSLAHPRPKFWARELPARAPAGLRGCRGARLPASAPPAAAAGRQGGGRRGAFEKGQPGRPRRAAPRAATHPSIHPFLHACMRAEMPACMHGIPSQACELRPGGHLDGARREVGAWAGAEGQGCAGERPAPLRREFRRARLLADLPSPSRNAPSTRQRHAPLWGEAALVELASSQAA